MRLQNKEDLLKRGESKHNMISMTYDEHIGPFDECQFGRILNQRYNHNHPPRTFEWIVKENGEAKQINVVK